MAEQTDKLEQRIAEQTGKIKVGSYRNIAAAGGWAGAGRTLWAMSAFCAALGAAIGVVAPFFPLLAGASSLGTAVGAIPASVATFTAIGMTTGFAAGAMTGRAGGVAEVVAQEQERRLKEWTARQILKQNPDAEIVADPPAKPEPQKPFWQRVKDTYRTYVNPKVGLIMTAIGAVGGLIMAGAYIATGGEAIGHVMPALGKLTGLGAKAFTAEGIKAAPGAFIAYTAGVMAAFGATWSINFPKIAAKISEFSGDMIGGRLIGREWGPEPAKGQQPEVGQPTVNTPAKELRADAPHTAKVTLRKYESYQELVAHKSNEPSAEPLAKR